MSALVEFLRELVHAPRRIYVRGVVLLSIVLGIAVCVGFALT